MKIAVFNRYWATCGGGERYAGALAQALATDHDVHLLSPTPVEWALLEERLDLDLSRTTSRIVPDTDQLFTTATSEYDLLVTCSFNSRELNGSRRGIYVVLFPAQSGSAFERARRVIGRPLHFLLSRDATSVAWGSGFYPAERSGSGVFRWTASEAHLHVTLPAGPPTRVRLTFPAFRRRPVPPADVLVEVDDRVLARTQVGGDLRPVELDVLVAGRGADGPITLVIRSDTFVPGGAGGDSRQLGVPLSSVQLGKGARSWLMSRFPPLPPHGPNDFLATYQDIVSISEFTRRWVRRRLERESRVIYPPVSLLGGGERKAPCILSVGRFFARSFGHSKKQLEMVRAFRSLLARGLQGWDLHLVGSCQQQHGEYLAQVQAEARGLPVHFHIDASGRELRELYRRASIYWHATGLGESERRYPERHEHFGISTVEAMSAGVVPIVVGTGGQREIVQHGVNGYHFRSLEDLAARTHLLANDPALRRRLADAARQRAGEFSTERLAARVRALVERVPSA